MFPHLEYTLVDTGAGIMAGTTEDTTEDTMEDTMAGIMEDTITVIEADTTEGTITEVFTLIGDIGDGDIGDGRLWDGPMPVGPTIPMEDTRIWGGPITLMIIQPLQRPQHIANPSHRPLNTGTIAKIRQAITHT